MAQRHSAVVRVPSDDPADFTKFSLTKIILQKYLFHYKHNLQSLFIYFLKTLHKYYKYYKYEHM